MRLVNDLGEEITKGSKVYDKDGNEHIVSYCAPPHSAASSGKMSVEGGFNESYVGCYGCEWIEREDREPIPDLNWKPVMGRGDGNEEGPPVDVTRIPKATAIGAIEDRLMFLIRERGYSPTLERSPDYTWRISFHYDLDVTDDRVWTIFPTSRVCDQWWLV